MVSLAETPNLAKKCIFSSEGQFHGEDTLFEKHFYNSTASFVKTNSYIFGAWKILKGDMTQSLILTRCLNCSFCIFQFWYKNV